MAWVVVAPTPALGAVAAEGSPCQCLPTRPAGSALPLVAETRKMPGSWRETLLRKEALEENEGTCFPRGLSGGRCSFLESAF